MIKKFFIKGMSCHSCELKIEGELLRIPEVKKVRANFRKGTISVVGNTINGDLIIKTIKQLGYKVEKQKQRIISAERGIWLSFLSSALIVIALIYLVRFLNLNPANYLYGDKNSMLFPLTLGLVAGLSTCMALVGGLVLGVSAKFAETNPGVSRVNKFKPHLLFNFGRIVSFFILGGLLGQLGSVFRVSGLWLGIMTVLIALTLLVVGLQLTEISPRIKFGFRIPRIIKKQNDKYSQAETFLLGALTFFLPCGFTQAMQIFAIGTGSFWAGATTMSLFALGTTPALLGIGGILSSVKESKGTKYLFRFIGVVLISFALFNLTNGINLIGFKNIFNQNNPKTEIPIEADKNKWGNPLEKERSKAGLVDGVQVIKATYDVENVLVPEDFLVEAGRPVRFEVLAKDDGEGCMGSILIPGLFDQYQLFEKNKTVIMEFTPQKAGNYLITCAMGVPAGTLLVR